MGFGRIFKTSINEISILVQVENLDGLKNLEEIIDTEGIDGVFIGPSDLAASMGKLVIFRQNSGR